MTQIAAILVGGKGTRLRSLVSDVPKPLATVAGEPFLFLILRELSALGIQKVILLTGYLHEKMVEACGNGSQFGLDIVYSREMEPLGTGGALDNARKLLQSCPEFLLLNGDSYLTGSLDGFVHQTLPVSALGILAIVKPDDAKRYGTVEVNVKTGRIEAFREKDQMGTGLVSAGVYKFSSRIFDFIPMGQPSSLERDIFPSVIARGQVLQSYFLDGILSDIGLPESYTLFSLERLMNSEELLPQFREALASWIVGFCKEPEYEL